MCVDFNWTVKEILEYLDPDFAKQELVKDMYYERCKHGVEASKMNDYDRSQANLKGMEMGRKHDEIINGIHIKCNQRGIFFIPGF